MSWRGNKLRHGFKLMQPPKRGIGRTRAICPPKRGIGRTRAICPPKLGIGRTRAMRPPNERLVGPARFVPPTRDWSDPCDARPKVARASGLDQTEALGACDGLRAFGDGKSDKDVF
jgi:hypothetical protein